MTCDWWQCVNFDDCKRRFGGSRGYPSCAACHQFDSCAVCARYVECADIVTRFLPEMFRRMVREIRLGEDTEHTQQVVRRNTCGGRKRG